MSRTILQSLIRTFFLQEASDAFFGRVNLTLTPKPEYREYTGEVKEGMYFRIMKYRSKTFMEVRIEDVWTDIHDSEVVEFSYTISRLSGKDLRVEGAQRPINGCIFYV